MRRRRRRRKEGRRGSIRCRRTRWFLRPFLFLLFRLPFSFLTATLPRRFANGWLLHCGCGPCVSHRVIGHSWWFVFVMWHPQSRGRRRKKGKDVGSDAIHGRKHLRRSHVRLLDGTHLYGYPRLHGDGTFGDRRRRCRPLQGRGHALLGSGVQKHRTAREKCRGQRRRRRRQRRTWGHAFILSDAPNTVGKKRKSTPCFHRPCGSAVWWRRRKELLGIGRCDRIRIHDQRRRWWDVHP